MVLQHRACRPSFRLPFCLSRRFFGIRLLVLSKFWHGATSPYEVKCDRARFFGISILFALEFCNENLHYLPCTSSNLIFEKNLVPEIGARMLSANQIAGFLNPTIYSEKMMKQPFLCMQILKVTNLKLIENFQGGHDQKWA